MAKVLFVAGLLALGIGCGGSDDVTSGADGGRAVDTGAGGPVDSGPRPDAQLPEGLGWIELDDTRLADVCPYDGDPSIGGVEGCSGIVEDWSGGIADTRRNRLIVWGGGHNGYYGNELYALDLGAQRMERLNDPSPPWPDRDVCSTQTENGDAASRHTYDGLAYIEHADRMFAFGGAPACTVGGISSDTWTFDFAMMRWESRDPHTGPTPRANAGAIADYDPVTRLVFLHDVYGLWSYDVDTNTYALLRDDIFIDYHLSGRIDPGRRLFLLMGNGELHAIDISAGSAYDMVDWTATGCDEVVAAGYPGLSFDAELNGYVAWAGGDSVYFFDPDSRTCTAMTDAGGPGPQVENGTNGRWRYFPSLGVFAVVNHVEQNAFLFRAEMP